MTDLSILDQSVPALREAIGGLGVEELSVLLAAEHAGKTRKSAVAALEEAIAAQVGDCASEAPDEAPAASLGNPEPVFGDLASVTSIHEGGTVHLGDGRRLCCGESALVEPDVAEALRDKGLAV